jgi:serine/threonine protein kinase
MIGSTIGHYRLEAELGRGGFGAVYRGVHLHLEDIQVAVKVFHAELSKDEEFVRLLRRECQVLHSLSHPGIVAFRDLVVEPSATAIVLELLLGRDLHKISVERGPMEPDEVQRILRGVLQPLAHGHSLGIVHRDIKPGNIFLCDDGKTKVMDYGIAKVTHTTHATQSGMVAGTLDYMSAERFDGMSPPSADVYAAGLVAWGLLAGRRACPSGDIPTKIGWHLRQGAPDIRSARPDVPAWFAELLLALTATDADQRPADAGQALALLDSLRAGTGPSSSAPAEPADAPRPPAPMVQPPPPEPVPLALPPSTPAARTVRRAPAGPAPETVAEPAPMPPPRPLAPPTPQQARRAAVPTPAAARPSAPRPSAPRPRPERRPPARRRVRGAPVEHSGRRFPWASLLVLLAALTAAGFIVSLLLRGA